MNNKLWPWVLTLLILEIVPVVLGLFLFVKIQQWLS